MSGVRPADFPPPFSSDEVVVAPDFPLSNLSAPGGPTLVDIGNQAGDAKKAIAGAAKKVEAVYFFPWQDHACMEPMNATARYTPDKCEVWVPTQDGRVISIVALDGGVAEVDTDGDGLGDACDVCPLDALDGRDAPARHDDPLPDVERADGFTATRA